MGEWTKAKDPTGVAWSGWGLYDTRTIPERPLRAPPNTVPGFITAQGDFDVTACRSGIVSGSSSGCHGLRQNLQGREKVVLEGLSMSGGCSTSDMQRLHWWSSDEWEYKKGMACILR